MEVDKGIRGGAGGKGADEEVEKDRRRRRGGGEERINGEEKSWKRKGRNAG